MNCYSVFIPYEPAIGSLVARAILSIFVIYLTCGVVYAARLAWRHGPIPPKGTMFEVLSFTLAVQVFWPLFLIVERRESVKRWSEDDKNRSDSIN